MEVNGDADDLDEDINRLQIVLQADEEKEAESDAEGELQSLHQDAEDEHRSFASRSRPSTRPSTCSDVTASSYPQTSLGPEGEDRYQLLDPSNVNPESCLAMNRAYQEVLLDLLRQTEMSLNENRVKQKELEEEIDRLSSGNKQTGFKNIGKTFAAVSIPYFKNKNGESPPDNPDVAAKQDLQEAKQHVRPQTAWTKFARKKLISAVAMDTLEKMLRPVMSRLELESEKMRHCRNQEEIDACRDRIETLQEEIAINKQIPESELIKNVDADKVDWMKIGVTGFECKMDAADCERTWKNILRPEINRDKWTEEEDNNLQSLVEKHNMRNWAEIAKELGTNRTPFQCLQHYQQHSQVYDNSPWTPEEDELLKEVVETCKYGKDSVQFHQVAYYIDGRSAVMCRKRWDDINPQKRKGRWTAHEDCLLMAGVQMFGNNNWLKVGELVPTRNVGQCRERWTNVLCPDLRPKIWNYEEDKEMLRLVQEYGPNWSLIASLIPGRTDNNILQRYRRLMTWKQQCEDFFAMPEKVQKNMILGQRQLEKKKKLRGAKRKFFVDKKQNIEELKWYKKQDEFDHYGDVGYLAKQLKTSDEVYDKIIEDRENNELVAPRPLPITKYRHRNSMALWRRKCHLQSLVEAEIKKVLEEKKDQEYQPKEVADRVAASLEPAVIKRHKAEVNRAEISRALEGKDPSELTVRQLLKISRNIKKKGRANSDTEDEGEGVKVKEEGSDDDDEWKESEIIGQVEEKHRKHRPMAPAHKKKLMEGRGRHYEVNKDLQRKIWAKYQGKHPTKSSGKHKKYRLFSKKVFKSHLSTEEQDKLRRKSLLLMLKSMGVDSIQALKKARRRFKKYSTLLKQQEEEKNDTDSQTAKSSTENSGHSLRHRSRSSIVSLTTNSRTSKPRDTRAKLNETTKIMLDLGKELNVPEEEDDETEEEEEEDMVEEDTPPRKKRRFSCLEKEKITDTDKAEGDTTEVSEREANTEVAGIGKSGISMEKRGNSEQEKDNGKAADNSSDVQERVNTAIDVQSEGADNGEYSAVQEAAEQNTNYRNPEGSSENTEEHISQNKLEVGKSGGPEGKINDTKSTEEAGKANEKSKAKDDRPAQPYTKKLPFIPPNHTNLLALKKLLLDKEKLFNKAADDFRVPELRREFYEKPKENTTPFVKTLLSVLNPDVIGIKRRTKRKLISETDQTSFTDCMERIKESPEFNQLKARFCAVFTWPALISTIKPPKDGQLVVPGIETTEQNGKDSEKENYDSVTIKQEIESSDESSESEAEVYSGRKTERQLKGFIAQDDNIVNGNENVNENGNENDGETENGLTTRSRRSYGGKCKEMVKLVYTDLESLEDVEMTDKEEMEIMIMNIITRRLGDKRKEISRATYNRERGKTLKRLGMHEKMKKLEKKDSRESVELTEIKQEPKPKRKRGPRRAISPIEPRRSTRISHHKPLEVYSLRKTDEDRAATEETAPSRTPSDNEMETNIIPENNMTINEGMQQPVTIIQQSEVRPGTSEVSPTIVSTNPAGTKYSAAVSETVHIDSVSSVSATNTASSPAVSVIEINSSTAVKPPSAMAPMVFTLPPTSAVRPSSSQASGSGPSAQTPLLFLSPVKPASSGSPSTEATAVSSAVPMMFSSVNPASSGSPSTEATAVSSDVPVILTSPGLSVSSASVPGASPLGLITLPLLPPSGNPASTLISESSAKTATEQTAQGLTTITIPPLQSTNSTATTNSSSITSSGPIMTSLPTQGQSSAAGIPASGASMCFQNAVGNNLIPMMVFVSPEQLSMLNAGNIAKPGVPPIGTSVGIGNTSNVVGTCANIDMNDVTNVNSDSWAKDSDSMVVSSHIDDAIKVNNSKQAKKSNVSNSAIVETSSPHDKDSTWDKNDVGNTQNDVEMNGKNDEVGESNANT